MYNVAHGLDLNMVRGRREQRHYECDFRNYGRSFQSAVNAE
jgi:hypothetical protein